MSPTGIPPSPFFHNTPAPNVGTPRENLPRLSKSDLHPHYSTILETRKNQYPEGSLGRFFLQQIIDGIENEKLTQPDSALGTLIYGRSSDVYPTTNRRHPIIIIFIKHPQGGLLPLRAHMKVATQNLEKITVSFREGNRRGSAAGESAANTPAAPAAAESSTVMDGIEQTGANVETLSPGETTGRNMAARLLQSLAQEAWKSVDSALPSDEAQATVESRTEDSSSQAANAAPESAASTLDRGDAMDIDVPTETQVVEESAVAAAPLARTETPTRAEASNKARAPKRTETPKARPSRSSTAPRVHSTFIASNVKNNFPAILSNLVTGDLILSDNLTPTEKENNTYRMTWVLPTEKRFSGALIQTAYKACMEGLVEVTPKNAHDLLGKAVRALEQISPGQRNPINNCLKEAHRSTNDGNSTLTLKSALKNLPAKFTDMSTVIQIFQRVAGRVMEVNPALHINPALMWKHCVSHSMLDTLQELGIDGDNPFLPYIDDTAEKTTLLNMAHAWDYMTQMANQETTPESLKNLMLKLWAICSGKSTPSDNRNIVLPEKNDNYTVLMEADENTPHGTMTAAGRPELMRWIDTLHSDYGVDLQWGNDDDEKDREEHGRTVVTLGREDTPSERLMNLLDDLANACIEEIEEANGNEDQLLAAQARLAMRLTQSRLFLSGNIDVGMMMVNFLRLQNKQSVPFSLPNADVLDGHSLSEIVDLMKRAEGRA